MEIHEFSYPGQDILIERASLSLKKGEISFLTGSNGSGKSTLSKLLLKFYKPNSGKILINSHLNLDEIPSKVWRNYISYVPQDIKIFNNDILFNICMEEKKNEKEIIAFCKKIKTDSIFIKFQESYWTILGEEGVLPSGGEKQLIALSRALYQEPKILILDEAMSSMDQSVKKMIWELLNEIKHKILILFITHDKNLTFTNKKTAYKLENKIISLV